MPQLILRFTKIMHLDPTLFNLGVQAVVQTANPDPRLFGKLSLSEVWVFFQDGKHTKVGIFLCLCMFVMHTVMLISHANVFSNA